MFPYRNVAKKDVLLYGITHTSLAGRAFIVYPCGNEIRVNTDFQEKQNGILKCCLHYDRMLCRTIEEYRKLTIEEIESQAYGSWWDGAR